MPGLTTTITSPYEAILDEILIANSETLSDNNVVERLQLPEGRNGSIWETVFTHEFYQILATYSINEVGFQRMWRLFDIVNIASDAKLCEIATVFLLVEALLDSQSIEGCRKVFDYLESRQERMFGGTDKNWQSKQLPALRSCNELLRRLSRAEDTVFCGRVFIFLFQAFPLGDKSSVNLRGEYHTDNVTHYDQSVKPVEEPEAMAVDPKAEEATPAAPTIKVETSDSVDTDALYPIFWALQEIFTQPTKLFEPTTLDKFKAGLEATMKKFKEVHRDEPRARSEEAKGTKRKLDNLDGSAFNPKYLTSRDLFELEIHDPAFRRHVLVQSLIVADFLLSHTPKAKARLENLKNKSVIYDFVLDEKEAKWATDMRADIATYLQQGTEGKFYYRMVDTVLARDKNWLRWKAESCPPIKLDPVKPEEFAEARDALQKATAPRQLRKTPMGALDLGFLDSNVLANPIDRFRDPERWQRPDLAAFRNDIANTDLDLDFADGEEKERLKEQKSSKIWRALRLGGRFGLLDKLDTEDRDGLNPLFGIVREPEVEETGANADKEADADDEKDDSGAPADALEQGEANGDQTEADATGDADVATEAEEAGQEIPVEGAADAEEAEQAEGTETQAPADDEMEGQESTAGEVEKRDPRQDAPKTIDSFMDDQSAGSPLSPLSETGPTADDSWIEPGKETPAGEAEE